MVNEGQEPTEGSEVPSDGQQELQDAKQKSDEYLRLLQRLQADFNNYKRRTDQERLELGNMACANFAMKMVPVIDDIDKALNAIPAELSENEWVAGIKHIRQKLESIMKAEGLDRIEAEGAEFDPFEHDAVVMVDAGDSKPGTVKSILRPGYKFKGKVVRPAQVSVAKRATETPKEPETAEQ